MTGRDVSRGVVLSVCLAVVQSAAQQATPTPSRAEPILATPPAQPVDTTRRTVKLAGARPSLAPSRAAAGALKELRVMSIGAGEARVALGTGPQRTVRPGDVIEGDTVREVGDGRIILSRPDSLGGTSTVVVSLEKERVNVRVIADHDTASRPKPPVR